MMNWKRTSVGLIGLVASLLTKKLISKYGVTKYGRSVDWALSRQNSLIKETRHEWVQRGTVSAWWTWSESQQSQTEISLSFLLRTIPWPHVAHVICAAQANNCFQPVEPIICGLQLQSLFGEFLWDCVFPTFLSPKFAAFSWIRKGASEIQLTFWLN